MNRFFLCSLLIFGGSLSLVCPDAAPSIDEGNGYSTDKLRHIDTADLAMRIRKKKNKKYNFTLIDTRNETDYREGSIPGAINIPFKKHRFLVENIAPITEDIICYGYPDNPSTVNAAVLLINHGYENVWFYEEGYDGWKNSPESTEKEEPDDNEEA